MIGPALAALLADATGDARGDVHPRRPLAVREHLEDDRVLVGREGALHQTLAQHVLPAVPALVRRAAVARQIPRAHARPVVRAQSAHAGPELLVLALRPAPALRVVVVEQGLVEAVHGVHGAGSRPRGGPRGAGSGSVGPCAGSSGPRPGLGRARCVFRPGGAAKTSVGRAGPRGRGAAPSDREGAGEARSQRAGRSKFGAHQASSYERKLSRRSERWAH